MACDIKLVPSILFPLIAKNILSFTISLLLKDMPEKKIFYNLFLYYENNLLGA